MALCPPYHSIIRGTECHHNNDKCTRGESIKKSKLHAGTGGHELCKHCLNLHSKKN